MALKKQYAQFELTDGTLSDPIRVIFADKVNLERTARAHNWDIEKDFTKVNSLLAWSAGRRTGAIDRGLSYDAFVEQLVDAIVDRGEDVDPTPKDQPTD